MTNAGGLEGVIEIGGRAGFCGFPGCQRRVVETARLSCLGHWFMLPAKVRDVVVAEYQRAATDELEAAPPAAGFSLPPREPYRRLALERLCLAHWATVQTVAGSEVPVTDRDEAESLGREHLDKANFYRRRAILAGQDDPFEGLIVVEADREPIDVELGGLVWDAEDTFVQLRIADGARVSLPPGPVASGSVAPDGNAESRDSDRGPALESIAPSMAGVDGEDLEDGTGQRGR